MFISHAKPHGLATSGAELVWKSVSSKVVLPHPCELHQLLLPFQLACRDVHHEVGKPYAKFDVLPRQKLDKEVEHPTSWPDHLTSKQHMLVSNDSLCNVHTNEAGIHYLFDDPWHQVPWSPGAVGQLS